MHILLIGATGRNGALVLAEALRRGHTVTALVRTPASVPSQPDLTLVAGTPLSLADLRAALRTPRAPDAVVVALNARRTSDSPFAALHPDSPPTLVHDAVRNILEAVRDDSSSSSSGSSTPKLVVNSMQGAGASRPSLALPVRLLLEKSNMRHTVDDHNAVDALLRGKEGAADGVDWVMVRPPVLVEGEALPVKEFGEDGSGVCWLPKITRKSVAAFMVDAVEKPDWDGKAPVITN